MNTARSSRTTRPNHSVHTCGLTASVLLMTVALSGIMRADDEPSEPLLLVDFEIATSVKLTPNRVSIQEVTSEGGKALQIDARAQPSWPGVTITPATGKWNLSGFFAVEMDVINPQDESVRVLLSVNNPGADGTKNNNTESVTVRPHGTATLQVPFGSWHGETNHPIDQSNIVSVSVLLDRPKKSHRFIVDNIRAVPYGSSVLDNAISDEFFKSLTPALGRGVNLGNVLEAPHEGAWGVRLEDRYFDLIHSAGFNSVRIPVRWSAHAADEAPYTIEPAFFDRVEWAIQQATSQQLYAVLNMHHYREIFDHPHEHHDRFLALWKQIAERFKDCPPSLYFELLNEPHANLDADTWNELAAEGIALVRKTNPTRKIVVGPPDWNGVNAMQSLVLPEKDRNLVVTFHYYSPFQFTHQGASWTGKQSNQWLGTTWTGTPAERQAVIADLDKALAWSLRHRRPIFLGEFGAYSKSDLESRVRWTRFVADEAVKRKMSFAYWEFCAGFGIYDSRKSTWLEPLKEALLPKAK